MNFRFRRLRPAGPVCALDVETTGTDPATDRIIEVGVVRVEPDGHARVLSQLIDPGRPVPPPATTVHGLTDGHLAGRPGFAAIAPGLLSFLGGADLVGFHLPFDLLVLTAEFARAGMEFDLAGRAVLDALAIFRRKEPRDLAAAVRLYLGRRHRGGHRAVADAAAALEVLDAQLARYPDLPARPEDLHRRLVEVDVAGRFRRGPGGAPVFAFGKHRGRPLAEVAAADPGYLRWLLKCVPLLPDAADLVRVAVGSDHVGDRGGR
jgi:DNA polymerase-3 subunit epsilon